MSTKIYEAYALKPNHDLYETLWSIRRRAEKNVQQSLAKLYNVLIAEAKQPRELREWLDPEPPNFDAKTFDYSHASRWVATQYRDQLGKLTRSLFDLDVNITIRRASRNKFLLIPYPGSGLFSDSLRFLRRHRALTDYHYQNSSDRPTHISAAAWGARKRTWGALLDEPHWSDKLVLEIVSYNRWFLVDPAIRLSMRQ